MHIPNTQLHAAYEILGQAGARFGLSHFGMYAIDAMRLEKGYGHWKGDFLTEFNPVEAQLARFVDMGKAFPGKSGLQAQITIGNRRERVILAIDSTTAPAQPGEGVFRDGAPVGAVTSAAWGYRTGKNLAMAYVDPALAAEGTVLEVLQQGRPVPASVCPLCLFDPENAIPRGSAARSVVAT